MTGSKRRNDHDGGGRGGRGGRNTPGGRGWTGCSSPPSPDNPTATTTPAVEEISPSPARENASPDREEEDERSSTSPQPLDKSPSPLRRGEVYTPPHLRRSSSSSGRAATSAGSSGANRRYPPSPSPLGSSSSSGRATSAGSSGARRYPPLPLPLGSSSPKARPAWISSPATSRNALPHSSASVMSYSSSRKALMPSDMLESGLLHFLNSFKLPSHMHELYKAHLKAIELTQCYELTIDFDFLLNANLELAMDVCNSQQSNDVWLNKVAKKFFIENGMMSQNEKIIFLNMPQSMTTAADAFQDPSSPVISLNRLYKGDQEVLTSTFRASQLIDAIICGIFMRLACGVSWSGTLTLDDIIFIEMEGKLHILITKDPIVREGALSEVKVLDVQGIWPLIEPFFLREGHLPVYFEELKSDLLNATPDQINEGWFLEYLSFHPGLMPSMGRRYFEAGIYQTVREFRLLRTDSILTNIFSDQLLVDWRDIALGSSILKPIYTYEVRAKKSVEGKGRCPKCGSPFIQQKEGGEEDEKAEHDEGIQQQKEGGEEDEKAEHDEGIQRQNKGGEVGENAELDEVMKLQKEGVEADEKAEHNECIELPTDANDAVIQQQQGGGDVDEKAEHGERSKEATELEKKVDVDLYQNTRLGLLQFKRNSNEHPRSWKLCELDETELLTANCFGSCLPELIKLLLRTYKMKGKFAAVWSFYKSTKADERRLPPVQ